VLHDARGGGVDDGGGGGDGGDGARGGGGVGGEHEIFWDSTTFYRCYF
jgi:hypothetical protein